MTASAVRPSSGSVLLDLLVTPGARVTALRGFDPVRGRVQVSVRAPPRAGRANLEVLRLFADLLGVPAPTVVLVSGASSRRKTIAVAGADPAEVLRKIASKVP